MATAKLDYDPAKASQAVRRCFNLVTRNETTPMVMVSKEDLSLVVAMAALWLEDGQ